MGHIACLLEKCDFHVANQKILLYKGPNCTEFGVCITIA